MKRNTETYVTISGHDENEDVIRFAGRVNNEFTADGGDLVITIITGYRNDAFTFIQNVETRLWDMHIFKQIGTGIVPEDYPVPNGPGVHFPAKEGDPVIIEIYDQKTGNVHYLHDLSPDDLPDLYRDVYNRLTVMSDLHGDPLSSHLITEEDFLPVLWMGWQFGEYSRMPDVCMPDVRYISDMMAIPSADKEMLLHGEWKHDPQTGKTEITDNQFENGDRSVVAHGSLYAKFSNNVFPEDPGAPGSANRRPFGPSLTDDSSDPTPGERRAWEDMQERRISGEPDPEP